LPLAVQMKVSRAIEFRTIRRVGSDRTININARTISTLSQPAGSLISDGLLSEDIFSRISPVVLEIPPLRYHKVDIPDLIEKFLSDLRKHNPRNILGMGKEALELCVLYDWPGNVRHLKNAVEYAFIMCAEQWIQPHHLPNYLHNEQSNFNLTYQAGSEKKQTNHLQKCK
jgi:DNA-binding NtrC family response regulator